ncbi:MAG: hypothetical protein KBT36_02910 [Kurthia sp.]|nr:hypothetical protein [Candidatus Kurthia equi]
MEIKIIDYGSVTEWLSAIGTLAAVFFSLYLLFRDTRTKIDIVVINDKLRWYSNHDKPNTYDVCITNLRPRTVYLKAIGIYHGTVFKKKAIARMTSGEEVHLGALTFGEMKNNNLEINVSALEEKLGTKIPKCHKLYIGVEDLQGKTHYKKFTP